MYGLIYYVQNLENDKIYVGQTTGLLKYRKSNHLNYAKNNSDFCFHKALGKCKDWEWNVLQFAYCKAELDALEKYWIMLFNSIIPNGYNIQRGGSYGKHSEGTKKKLSKLAKGRIMSDEQKKKISDSLRGKPGRNTGNHHSEKTKRKISESRKGKNTGKRSIEHCKNISESLKGHIVSDSTKEKLRKFNLGNKHIEETKRKLSDFNKGKILSEEHKKKIGIGNKGKKRSDEMKMRMSDILKGKRLSEEPKQKISMGLKNKKQEAIS